MKVYRVFYWAVMLCALLFGLYSGNRFSWLLFLAQALILTAALGINIWTAYSFSYLQELSTPQGEKGQTVGLHISIYNDKPFPFTRMKVMVEAPDPAENQSLAIDLAPKASCSFDLQLSLPRRGEFFVGMTRLDLQDVFGLLPMHFYLRRLPYYRQRPLLVLPQVREVALPAGRANIGTGPGGIGTGQEELSLLRDWMPGDRLSRIHWAASAKTRLLLSRQYQDPVGDGTLIFLDCRALDDEHSDILSDCAVALVYSHLSQGGFVDLRSGNPQAVSPERAFSLAELTCLREWLALLRFDQATSGEGVLAEILAVGRYSRVYLLGGRFEPKLLSGGVEAVSWHYWVMEPLPAGTEAGYQGRAASIGQTDVARFLSEHMGEEP